MKKYLKRLLYLSFCCMSINWFLIKLTVMVDSGPATKFISACFIHSPSQVHSYSIKDYLNE